MCLVIGTVGNRPHSCKRHAKVKADLGHRRTLHLNGQYIQTSFVQRPLNAATLVGG